MEKICISDSPNFDEDLYQVYLNRVQEIGMKIVGVPEEYLTEELYLAAVGQDGKVIRLIENPSEEVKLAAVKKMDGQ